MSKQRLKILFDAHALIGQKTGVGYYESQIIEELARQHKDDLELIGYYHNFLYRKKIPPLPTGQNIRYRRIAFMPGQIVNLLRRFHILLPVELLTLTRADFIFFPNFLGLASLYKSPSASVIHDLTFIDLPDYVSRRNLHDLVRFIPAQIKRSRFIVTVSEFSKQRIHDHFQVPSEDILVTPNAPEIVPFKSEGKEQEILHGLGISGNYILTLGTVEPRKNLLNMFEAYLKLPEKLQKEYAFVVAGKVGWNCEAELTQLEQLKADGRNVIHLGYVNDEQRAALYRHATLFTSASYYEGFGMPALEAMSYGAPCAISDIAVFREVASDDAALYFDQGDPSAINDAWQRLLTDQGLRQRLVGAGKTHASSYSWSRAAEALYDKIIETVQAP